MTDVASIITGAAQAHGQDPSVLLRIGQIESSLNPAAHNPKSGADGLFQFMPKTAAAYGLANPQDPATNADAAARLLRDNRATLTKYFGRDPTGPELYLAHQQGAGNAASLLAHPDAPAASIVGTKAVLQNGGNQGMTSREYTDMWTSRYGNAKPAGAHQIGTLFASGALPSANPSAAPAIARGSGAQSSGDDGRAAAARRTREPGRASARANGREWRSSHGRGKTTGADYRSRWARRALCVNHWILLRGATASARHTAGDVEMRSAKRRNGHRFIQTAHERQKAFMHLLTLPFVDYQQVVPDD